MGDSHNNSLMVNKFFDSCLNRRHFLKGFQYLHINNFRMETIVILSGYEYELEINITDFKKVPW